jgi:hypothetical protein
MIETCDNWTIGSHFRVVSTFDLAFLEGAWVDGEKEHRLEVYACYATLFSGLSSGLSEPSRSYRLSNRSDARRPNVA